MFIVFSILILMQFQISTNNYPSFKYEDTSYGSLFASNVSNIFNNNCNNASTKTLFQIPIRTENKKSNLKANIFDKMLSDEMLSIKQQIHEKDATYPSIVQISTKGSIPTPTLELKQMWPIEKVQSHKEMKYNFEQHMKNIDGAPDPNDELQVSINNNSESNHNGSMKEERVLEMRSLSEKLHKIIKTSSFLHHVTRKCTCTNFNSQTTKSYHSSDFGRDQEKKLNFGDDLGTDSNAHLKCSRTYSTIVPTAYPFYVTYSPYFVGTMADLSNMYYHPDVISDLKIPKRHKNRKHKKPAVVYDDDSDESLDEYYVKTTRKRKDKSKNNYEFKIVYEATQEPVSDKQFNEDNIQIVNKDKFVEDIVDDLKVYYNEAVIKDCYCSSCSYKIGLQLITFVYLLQWLV